MSTRSLIGVLDADGRGFRARYCHSDGYPTHQLPELATALHHFHDDHVDALTTALLSQDWSVLAAAEAHIGHSEGERDHLRPAHVQPYAGIGYYYTDIEPGDPITGTLDEQPEGFEWLYLFTTDQLRVLVNHRLEQRWRPFEDLPTRKLTNLDLAELAKRQRIAR